MRVIIVGAGDVGWNLAQELTLMEFQEVTLIDNNPQTIQRTKGKLNVSSILGDATNPTVLIEAGIKEAQLVIAVTDHDEVNLVVSSLWARHFGVKHTIARVHKREYTLPDYANSAFHNNINHLISTEELASEHIIKLIHAQGAINVADFAGGKILLREFEINQESPILDKKLAEISEISANYSFLIVGIQRGDKVIIPSGEEYIRNEDRIFVILPRDFLPLFIPMVKPRVQMPENIVIFGGTRLGLQLAQSLEDTKNITLIDPNRNRAEICSQKLKTAEVIVGKMVDREILHQARVAEADIFIGAAEEDHENLFATLIAKKEGAKQSIIITNEPNLDVFLHEIGVDVVINPKLDSVASILRYVRRGVKSIAIVSGLNAEVYEMVPMQGSAILDKPLEQLGFPRQAIIGAIFRNGEAIIPDGKARIKQDDSVVIFALPEALEKVEKMFTKRKGFFGLI